MNTDLTCGFFGRRFAGRGAAAPVFAVAIHPSA